MRVTHATLDEMERRYRDSVADLRGLQARVLQRILAGAARSRFVREHRIEAATVDDFRARVPIQGYEEHLPYIERMRAGEADELFDGAAPTFLVTSGSTAGPKYFPARDLTRDEQALVSVDDDYETALFLREHPDLAFRGRHLGDDYGLWLPLVGAPPAIDERGRRIGFISGYTYERVYRAFPELFFTKPTWLRHLSGTQKLYVLTRLAAAADIRVVNGLPDAASQLARVLHDSTARFVRDIHDGTLSEEIPRALEAELPPLHPDPDRARALERAAAADGGLWPRHLWPKFAMLRTYCQSGMRLYGDFLRDAFGPTLRDTGIHSTEGHALAFCLRSNDAALAMSLHRNFCEFVDDDGRAHLAHELEVGATYRLVLTTYHGLYRYDTRDLFQVIGHAHHVPIVELRGRAGTISLVGEKLTESHVVDAVTAAVAAIDARVVGYLVIPHPPQGDRRGFYELALECEVPPDRERLAREFEAALGRSNVWYQEYRLKTGALDGPVITVLPAGWFSAFRARMLAERGVQSKQPIFWTKERPADWPAIKR